MFYPMSTLSRHRKGFAARRKNSILRVEVLEGREVPTGNVVASLSGTTLVLNAQVDNVVPENNDQEILISGNGLGSVIVQGQNGTAINTGGGEVQYDGVAHITIHMNKGDDTVTIEGVEITGNLTYSGGEGDDTITIQNGATSVGGTLTINGGNGDSTANLGVAETDQTFMNRLIISNGTGLDTTLVGGADFDVTTTMSVNNGNGGSSTQFLSTATLSVGGNTTINNGSGDDTVVFGTAESTSVVLHNTAINNGAGTGTTLFNGFDHVIAGNLTINNGTGVDPDQFEATGDSFTVIGRVAINNGHGGSLTAFHSAGMTQITGATNINNGNGDDVTEFGNAGGTILLGPVTINNGNEEGDVRFNGGEQTINGRLLINNGTNASGTDDFVVEGDSFVVTDSLVVNNGHGDTTVNINSLATSIAGALTINSGNGADDIAILGASLHNTTINTGNGGANVTIGADVLVTGNLTINTGAEVDALSLGGEVTRNLTVNTNNEDDEVTISLLIVDGLTSINLGNGDDTLTIDDSLFLGNVTVNLGAGGDTVNMETADTGIETTFAKRFALQAASGDDTVTIGIDDDVDDRAIFLGPVSMDGSSGFDQLFSGPPKTNSFTVNPALPGWEVKL